MFDELKWIIAAIVVFKVLEIIVSELKKPIKKTRDDKVIKLKNVSYPYEKANILTDNEKQYYKILRQYAEANNLHLLTKIRIADFVKIQKGIARKENDAAFGRICAKHIDFMLCKKEDLSVFLLIEIDDRSHEKDKVKQRDLFVETLYETVGYKLIRAKTPEELTNKLKAETVLVSQ